MLQELTFGKTATSWGISVVVVELVTPCWCMCVPVIVILIFKVPLFYLQSNYVRSAGIYTQSLPPITRNKQ